MKKILLFLFFSLILNGISFASYLPTVNNNQTPYATVVVSPDANDTYVCIANPGTTRATALWQCQYVFVSGTTTTITWANGSSAFNSAATNPASLSYS